MIDTIIQVRSNAIILVLIPKWMIQIRGLKRFFGYSEMNEVFT